MITLIPGQSPSTPPRRSTAESDAAATPTANLQRSGGVVHYTLGTPPQAKPAAREPRLDLPACGGLSREEMGIVCRVANAAYDYCESQGTLGMEFLARTSKTQRKTEWRKAHMVRHFQLPSLTTADHQQFNDLVAHFENMIPKEAGRAFRRSMRGDGDANKKRIALFKIRQVCAEANLHFPGYPLSIARPQFKVASLDDLQPKQAWALFYTMTGRGRAKSASNATQLPANSDDPF